jgi:hypothetical protein
MVTRTKTTRAEWLVARLPHEPLRASLYDAAIAPARRLGEALRLPVLNPIRLALAVSAGVRVMRDGLSTAGALVPPRTHTAGAT